MKFTQWSGGRVVIEYHKTFPLLSLYEALVYGEAMSPCEANGMDLKVL